MKKVILIFAAYFLLHASNANAVDNSTISCTSQNIPEVTCGDEDCQAGAPATPLSFDVDDTGSASACMYSGCYEGGKMQIFKSDAFITYHIIGAPWSSGSGEPGDTALTVPVGGGIGSIISGGFVMPMRCVLGGGSSK